MNRPYLHKVAVNRPTEKYPYLDYGYINYSSFGYSVHYISKEGYLARTPGMSEETLLEYYDILDEIPAGYKLNTEYMALEEI